MYKKLIKKTFFLTILALWGLQSHGQSYQHAKDFILYDIQGEEIHLYDYLDKGQAVILDFFAVWCGTCQINAPHLETFYEEWGPNGNNQAHLIALEMDMNTSDEELKDFIRNNNSQLNYVNDIDSIGIWYNVRYFPTYFVVLPNRQYIQVSGMTGLLIDNIEYELNQYFNHSTSLIRKELSKPDLFPSLSSDLVFIRLNGSKVQEMKIIGINGRIMDSQNIRNGNGILEIPISAYPSGMYFIYLKTDNNIHSLKFMKN